MTEAEPLTLDKIDSQIEALREREAQELPEGKHQPTIGDLLYVRKELEREVLIRLGSFSRRD